MACQRGDGFVDQPGTFHRFAQRVHQLGHRPVVELVHHRDLVNRQRQVIFSQGMAQLQNPRFAGSLVAVQALGQQGGVMLAAVCTLCKEPGRSDGMEGLAGKRCARQGFATELCKLFGGLTIGHLNCRAQPAKLPGAGLWKQGRHGRSWFCRLSPGMGGKRGHAQRGDNGKRYGAAARADAAVSDNTGNAHCSAIRLPPC